MLADGEEALVEVAEAAPATELELLEAQELRLLAAGLHLPVELTERVDELGQQRRVLELLWREP
jgi:hypothetical protein